MIEDAYVRMIIDERNKMGISTRALCAGVYNEDMFYLVEQGKRTMDRVTAKRLLARLGVDNGNYEHYLDCPNYDVWQMRMRIINLVEIGKLSEAEDLLKKYSISNINSKNISRDNIEKQFTLFMKTQILKNKTGKDYSVDIESLYEEAVKLTVPNIDEIPIERLLLSPLEFNLVLEYKRGQSVNESVNKLMEMYRGFLQYIEKSLYGKPAVAKIYPKVVTYMYKAVSIYLDRSNTDNVTNIYRELFGYVKKAKQLLVERKLLYYMVEILEIEEELFSWIIAYDGGQVDEYSQNKQEISLQLRELKQIYSFYGEEAYMKNDCYLYRESGIYCANEIIKVRRDMLGLSQEQVCRDDISLGTIKRVENGKKAMKKETLKVLFERLRLYPSCVNMGIVTDKKDVIEKYEALRYAITSFKNEEAQRLLCELKKMLPKHPINEQVLLRIESLNRWRLKEIRDEYFIESLSKALEYTISFMEIKRADNIFITSEELMTLYLISVVYKEMGNYEDAMYYVEDIWKYCKRIEEQEKQDEYIGIYELIMEYMGNLFGDIKKYEESNDISHKLIKICLRLRRSGQIHPNIYNIAWNNNECNKDRDAFKDKLKQCIVFSQLTGDINHQMFYNNELIAK